VAAAVDTIDPMAPAPATQHKGVLPFNIWCHTNEIKVVLLNIYDYEQTWNRREGQNSGRCPGRRSRGRGSESE